MIISNNRTATTAAGSARPRYHGGQEIARVRAESVYWYSHPACREFGGLIITIIIFDDFSGHFVLFFSPLDHYANTGAFEEKRRRRSKDVVL